MDKHLRIFRRLLRMLPADFQADYARDMERTFQAQRRDARRERGGIIRLWMETVRDLLRTAPREHFDQFEQDVTYAVRNLRRRPGPAIAAIAMLAIGIGGVTAILSVVNGVDWRPLGYFDPDRVVFVQERFKGQSSTTTGYATFADWRLRSRSFVELAAAADWSTTLAGPTEAELVTGMRVTPGYFRAIGIEPALGRGFDDSQNRWDNRRFVVLSAGLWRRRFNADPGIVGRAIQLGGRPYVVTGVMPDGIEDLIGERVFDGTSAWVPLAYDVTLPFACRTCRHIRVVGRLRPGVASGQAQAELDAITQQLEREHPGQYAGAGARVTAVADVLLGPVRPALYLLLAAVGVLLMIASANVANLLLVRSIERAPEIATRRALGIANGRLVRQLLTESVVLAVIGALCGLVVARLGLHGLIAVAPASVPRIADVALDGRVLALTVLVTAVVGIGFGTLPAWHLASADVVSVLRGARTVAGGSRSGRVLVAGNVALAIVLLAIAALLGRSFVQLLRVDPGFEARDVTTASIALAGPAYAEQSASLAFYRGVLERLRRNGEVAALTTQLPIEVNDSAGFHVVGRLTANPEDAPIADRFAVTPEYFRALRIPVVRGRGFSDADHGTSMRVAIVNRTAADRLFGESDPIGQRIILGGRDGAPHVVVGIVGDVRHRGLSEPVSHQAYIPLSQFYDAPVRLVLRTTDTAAAARIRAAIAAIDRTQAVHDIRLFQDIVSGTLDERRFLLWLVGVFGAAALVLSVIGLYGVVSYIVAQRQRDIGVRVALGAARADIGRLVLRIGMAPVVIGLTAGLALVAVVTRPLEGMLFSVRRLDATALGTAVAVLFASALIACFVPARRAMRVDPMSALRAE